MIKNLYLIKRGERPTYHKAPFHPVIICTRKDVAIWQAGDTSAGAWVWVQAYRQHGGRSGWLLHRWNGLDIDYGHVVHSFALPDGIRAGFWRDYQTEDENYIGNLLPGAIWWSTERMPDSYSQWGVVYPPDEFSQMCIVEDTLNDGMRGFKRETPSFWPKPVGVE